MKIFFCSIWIIISCVSEKNNPRYFNIINNLNNSIYYGSSYSQSDFSLKSIDFIPRSNSIESLKIESKKII